MIHRPRALRPGDTLGVVSPASPIKPELLEKGLAHFHAQGFKSKIFPHAMEHTGYLAGSDEARARDLMAAFEDPEVHAVLCTRGGYGCQRLLPHLDFDRMATSRRMLIGFSDITTLHLALQRRGAVSLHAPMPLTLAYDREPWVYESAFGHMAGKAWLHPACPTPQTVVPGVAEGLTVGGCLCLLCDSIGTPEELDTRGKLLFIEDVDENPHRVDAMMTHLLNAGKLHEAAGIVVGEMTRTDERRDESIGARPWIEVVSERLLRANVPSVVNFSFGHAKAMHSLFLGLPARLNSEEWSLEFLDSPCSD